MYGVHSSGNTFSWQPLHTKVVVATIVSALSAIAIAAGIVVILAASGVPVHPFNSFSCLTLGGGIALAAIGSLSLILSLFWVRKILTQSRPPRIEDFGTRTSRFSPVQGRPMDAGPPIDINYTNTTTLFEIKSGIASELRSRAEGTFDRNSSALSIYTPQNIRIFLRYPTSQEQADFSSGSSGLKDSNTTLWYRIVPRIEPSNLGENSPRDLVFFVC